MFDRDAARDIKMKQFGVQVRPVSEFVSCGLPTKGTIVTSQAEPENCWAVHMINNWYLSKSVTRVG